MTSIKGYLCSCGTFYIIFSNSDKFIKPVCPICLEKSETSENIISIDNLTENLIKKVIKMIKND